MPKKKTTEAEDARALAAWRGKKAKEQNVSESVLMSAAIGHEMTLVRHAIRSRGVQVFLPNEDDPDHPGWRVVGITDGENGLIKLDFTRADQHWTDRPNPEMPHLHRGGGAGWHWFTGRVEVSVESATWRAILKQTGVKRHSFLAED